MTDFKWGKGAKRSPARHFWQRAGGTSTSWPLLLKYRSCPAPASPAHLSGWWGRAQTAAGRKAGVFAGTRAQAQCWGSSGIHHGRVPSQEGPEGRPQCSGGGHSASPCTPRLSGHSPAGKQQLSRDGPAATSPSPCSPLGTQTLCGSASRGSSGPGGVSNCSRSTAPCPEPPPVPCSWQRCHHCSASL